MKNTFLISLLFILGLSACTKTTDPVDFEWKIGHDLQSYENQLTPISKTIKFNIANESFCTGSTGIRVKLYSDDKEFINENVLVFPYSKEITVTPGQKIHIETKLEDHPNPDAQCVWLGNVICTINN